MDDESWQAKQNLIRRQTNVKRESSLFSDYVRQSFIDTLTLYLHGICCDIDVETGPRQLPSRYLRKRLNILKSLYPPPAGYAVFPEDSEPGNLKQSQQNSSSPVGDTPASRTIDCGGDCQPGMSPRAF